MSYRGSVRRSVVATLLAGPTALACAAIALASACSYDWTIGDPFRGVPGAGDATSVTPVDAAGRPGARQCERGRPCSCLAGRDGGACLLDCLDGQCDVDCTGATACSVVCAQQCLVTCGDAGSCELLECPGGQCSMQCGGTSSCRVASCAGGQCGIECGESPSCVVETCAGGQCSCEGPGCR